MEKNSLHLIFGMVSFLFASCSVGGFSGTGKPTKETTEKCTTSPCPPSTVVKGKTPAKKGADTSQKTDPNSPTESPGGEILPNIAPSSSQPAAGAGTVGGGTNPGFSGNTIDETKLPEALKEKCAPSKIKVFQTRMVFEPVNFKLCQDARPRYTEISENGQSPFRWNSIVETNKTIDVPKGVTVCGVDFDFYNYQAFYHSDQVILHFNNKILMTTALSAEYSAAGLVNEVFYPYRRDLLEGKLMKTNPTTFDFGACAGLKQGLAVCHFPPTVTRRETIGADVMSFIPKAGLREKFAQQLGQNEGLSFGLVTGSNVANQACNSGAFFDVKVLYSP